MEWNLGFFVAYIATAAADIQEAGDKSLGYSKAVPNCPALPDNAAARTKGQTAATRPTR
ncbi:hypothetical protein ABRY74_04795 [Pseudomonas guariconensis]|uniref:hypothetical protein n=1 Tax=Pseudomonas TaxID=286 RepID=UPI0015E07DA2|nr:MULTISPECIES: hypothetical protein [Pseudomonas]MDM9596334.1 hypothetical protein [Pseudomonas guariconensis]URD42390.1 hypothetical protein M6G63_23770 [Pseudomonas sp. BYT-5]URK97740.1 hypothetical protein J5X93_24420 [Pseudomonas sp. BYT-1]